MKKALFLSFVFATVSGCVVLMTPKSDTKKDAPEKEYGEVLQLSPNEETQSPAQYATVRPDQQPLQDYPGPSNWEFYSQKGGTPLRRANIDSVGKNFRPDIFEVGDTTRRNKFIEHGDSVFYRNFYGDSLLLGLQSSSGSVSLPSTRIAYGTGSGITGSANLVYDSIAGDVTTRLTNSVVSTTADAVQKITAVSGGGDPQLQIGIGTSTTNSYYYLGIDNSASDNFFMARTTSGQAVGSGNLYWQAQSAGTQILYYTPSNLPAIVISADNTTIGTGNESIQVAPDVITAAAQDGADVSSIQLAPTTLDIAVDGALDVTAATTDFHYVGGNPQIDGGATSIDLYSDDGTGFLTIGNTSAGIASGNNDISLDEASQQISIYAPLGLNLQSPGGNIIIGGGSLASEIRMYEPAGGGSNITGWVAGTMAADYGPYIMPVDAPADGQVLTWGTGNQLRWDPTGGSGTVTSFSAGNLSPLFTTNVATATTTPALTFALTNQTANTVFAGPTGGGAATPTFRALVAADIPSSAAGDFFKDGGNSFGAAATLGTNDANTLSFEINNVARASLNTSGVWNVTDESATTNTVIVREQIGTNSSGTPAVGFGTRSEFYAESSTTANRLQAFMQSRWSTATDGTRASEMDYGVVSSGGTEVIVMTMEASGDVGIGTTSPFCRLSNLTSAFGDGVNVESGGFGWGSSSSSGYAGGVQNSSGVSGSNGFLAKCSATDNGTRALTASVGTTRILSVTGDSKVGVLDDTPESELDVTGTTATNHLIGQNLTPTITVNTAGAGTGATASMVNAQSSDLAGRFSITSGTGTTGGLWATVTFAAGYAITPVVVIYCDDENCAELETYTNESTTGFEFFVRSGVGIVDATTYEFKYHVLGGK